MSIGSSGGGSGLTFAMSSVAGMFVGCVLVVSGVTSVGGGVTLVGLGSSQGGSFACQKLLSGGTDFADLVQLAANVFFAIVAMFRSCFGALVQVEPAISVELAVRGFAEVKKSVAVLHNVGTRFELTTSCLCLAKGLVTSVAIYTSTTTVHTTTRVDSSTAMLGTSDAFPAPFGDNFQSVPVVVMT